VWPYGGALDVEQVWEAPTWTEARATVQGSEPAELAFRTLFFPGWRAYVDGRPAALRPAPFDHRFGIGHGFAIVAVPPGTHQVQLAFGPTLPRVSGGLVSLLSLGMLLLGLTEMVGARWPRLGPKRTSLRAAAAVAIAGTLAVYLIAGLWPLWRAPGRATPPRAAVALDLAGAARSGQGVRFMQPDGAAPGAFVDVRSEVIAGNRRTWLYMHPPSEASIDLLVPARAVFQAGLGVAPRGWDEPDADGVRFVLEVVDGQGERRTLLDEVVQPQTRAEDRGWRFALVDLGAYAGQRVTLVLRTEGRDTPLYDWAGWGTPMVYVDRTARYPPPTGVASAVTPPRR
jgi:hypothetical protein